MRIGILGGTFDPIHYGHIRPALEVKAQLNLDTIWLMPNHIPPHKPGPKTSSTHRLAMVHLVCDLCPEFDCCDMEIRRDSPSYTVTSLEALTQAHPEHEFYFIMGMDSFMQLESWYLWQTLFDLCQLVVCQRPGWELCSESNMAKRLKQARLADEARQDSSLEVKTDTPTRGKIFPVTITEQDISSTDIREKLRQGADLSQLMPAAIISYIKQHQLYP